jgi:hypothetical protein
MTKRVTVATTVVVQSDPTKEVDLYDENAARGVFGIKTLMRRKKKTNPVYLSLANDTVNGRFHVFFFVCQNVRGAG